MYRAKAELAISDMLRRQQDPGAPRRMSGRSSGLLFLLSVLFWVLAPAPGFAANFTLKKLEIELFLNPGGTITVSQIYTWPAKGRPTFLHTDVPSAVSMGIFYKPMGLSYLRTHSAGGIEKMPIKSTSTLRSKSVRVRVEEMYKYEGMGPSIAIDYVLATPYRDRSFSASFFGTDDFPGKITVQNLELTVRWEGQENEVEQILFRLYEGREEIGMRMAEQSATMIDQNGDGQPDAIVDPRCDLRIDREPVGGGKSPGKLYFGVV